MRRLLNRGSAAIFLFVGVGLFYLMMDSRCPENELIETDQVAAGLTNVDPRPVIRVEIASHWVYLLFIVFLSPWLFLLSSYFLKYIPVIRSNFIKNVQEAAWAIASTYTGIVVWHWFVYHDPTCLP